MSSGFAATPATIAEPTSRPAGIPAPALYALTIFLSAFLLFQVQLIIAKYILPWFGGSPSVWNTCLLLFQVLLLAGYCYAHLLSTRLPASSQTHLHVILLLASLVTLIVVSRGWPSPITPGAAWRPLPGSPPVWQVISVLLVSVGFPFLILSTTGPLLQVWFSRIEGRSPYHLYALSNAGSLLGLLSYPFLEERFLHLRTQGWIWSLTYMLFLAACGACAWLLKTRPLTADTPAAPVTSETASKPTILSRFMWLAFAACASAMLLATTNLICQEISVIPLLWVLPLCLYLLSFILCFQNDRWYRRGIFHSLYALAVFAALTALSAQAGVHILAQIAVLSTTLFSVCMVCHGELARSKPGHEYLSTFYLTIAAGGALGSIFVVLIAPRIFHRFWEFQLALILCGVLLFAAVLLDRESWFYKQRLWRIIFALVVIALVIRGYSYSMYLIHAEAGGRRVLFRTRNFFGVKTVSLDQYGIWLRHGRTQHGVQLTDPSVHDEPTLYYKRLSGIGLVLDHYPRPLDANGVPRPLRVGVVGLGIGTLATYGHPGDYFRFYEIDPEVLQLSLGERPFFSFLQDSRATVDIALGDARLSLEKEANRGQLQKFDVLVLDAFSSDSIPVHLLTREAMAVYIRHLAGPDSVVAFHLSNRALDLRPVADALSREYHFNPVEVEQPGFNDWVIASANPAMISFPELKERATPVTIHHAVPLWTDEYSNLLGVLRPMP